MTYQAKKYWEDRLNEKFSLSGTGGLANVAADGAGIGAGALAARGQAARVAVATIRAEILQPADGAFDELAKFAFHRKALFQKVLDTEHFVGGEVLCFLTNLDLRGGERLLADGRTHAIKILERDLDPLIIRNIHTEDTHGSGR